ADQRVEPGLRADLRDARAHLPEADDADALDRHDTSAGKNADSIRAATALAFTCAPDVRPKRCRIARADRGRRRVRREWRTRARPRATAADAPRRAARAARPHRDEEGVRRGDLRRVHGPR